MYATISMNIKTTIQDHCCDKFPRLLHGKAMNVDAATCKICIEANDRQLMLAQSSTQKLFSFY